MGTKIKRKQSLIDDLETLRDDLCIDWGFCELLGLDQLVANGQELTADRFADAVLQAEGMNPHSEVKWRRQIRAKFVERYGLSVSQGRYRWKAD